MELRLTKDLRGYDIGVAKDRRGTQSFSSGNGQLDQKASGRDPLETVSGGRRYKSLAYR
jgi:hypothetical protein